VRCADRTFQFHVGVKAAYDLFPKALVERLTKARKEKWDATARVAEANLHRAVQTVSKPRLFSSSPSELTLFIV